MKHISLHSLNGFVNNKYYNIYLNLCYNRQQLRPTENRRKKGYETHHIVPKCLGGTDDKTNLVHLTYREHFLAHRLLTKFFPSNFKLNCAVWMMAQTRKVSSKKYAKARLAFIEGLRNRTFTIEFRQRLSESQKGENNSFYGRSHSLETRGKISEAMKGENHPFFGTHLSEETRNKISCSHLGKVTTEETKEKISLSLSGRVFTEDHRDKISKANKGKSKPKGLESPLYGKARSDETKEKISKTQRKNVYCTPLGSFDSLLDAASIFKVSRRTIKRWIDDETKPEFYTLDEN